MPRPAGLLAVALAVAASGAAACARPAPAPRLLLLISVDTLRADHLGAYGSERGLTPRLDALARESLVFRAAYAPAPFTLPSMAALFSGRYPETLGVVSNASRLPPVPTLASELAARGWRTGAVVGNLALRRPAGLAAGFELYDDALPQREAVRGWPERVAAATTDAALAMLDRLGGGDGRALVWVHYVDPHGPYTPPAGLRERYLAEEALRFDAKRELTPGTGEPGSLPAYQYLEGRRDLAFYRAGYAGEIRYVDSEIGRLLDGLGERGLGRDPLVVFTADHGEALGEGGLWFDHRDLLTDALVRVPLLVRLPSGEAGPRDDLVSLVDLFPTLLAALEDLPVDGSYPGRDLLAPGAAAGGSRPYLATLGHGRERRVGLVDAGHKLVVSQGPAGPRISLYRRGDDDVDVVERDAPRARALGAELEALRGRLAARPEERQDLRPEEREQLHRMGYLQGDAPPEPGP